jgi:hypothetical protein
MKALQKEFKYLKNEIKSCLVVNLSVFNGDRHSQPYFLFHLATISTLLRKPTLHEKISTITPIATGIYSAVCAR